MTTIIYKYDNYIAKLTNEIPRILYQTWHTKSLPPKMRESVELLRKTNPEFTHILHDDDDCRAFIAENFEPEVLQAFDALVPGAYKSDLWRYCVLYKTGGVYLDIKYIPVNGFKLEELTNKERFVLDNPPKCIYNAFMMSMPENPMLREAIDAIIQNVKTQFYGECPLEISGPKLLGKIYDKYYRFEDTEIYFKSTNWAHVYKRKEIIYNRERELFVSYIEYRDEQKAYQIKEHYGGMWANKCVYLQKDPL